MERKSKFTVFPRLFIHVGCPETTCRTGAIQTANDTFTV